MVKRTLDGRLLPLRNAIHEYLSKKTNAIVLDVGAGGGLLTAWAAECENVSQVYAIEDDPLLLEQTYKGLENHPNRNRITILQTDNLLTYNPDQTYDLLICEVISTALIEQPQMPLINHYRQFLKLNGLIIPEGLINLITLLDLDFSFCNSQIKLPAMFDAYITSIPKEHELSNPCILNVLSFHNHVPNETEVTIQIQAIASGWVRSIRLLSKIIAGDKKIISPNSICHPIISPLEEPVYVEKNQTVNISCFIPHQTIDENNRASARPLPEKIKITISPIFE